ncbi:hypothetical protein EDF38_0911 [Frigoribacterium sp. PhB160]|uniref:ArnT family glycosyltransferase n=1 Tax=Frigoribacterium sp. PhB160 TaxID=2485192 RepID=UPI000F46738C|nr:hypothetical protein [Frigoribacterium sp. PhB160]ROS61813.1 hypothetical protein EDF38_0911 [Frigoribacterium sp. PhB160]
MTGLARRVAARTDLVLVAALVVVVAASIARATSTPLLSTADETAHLDYALQVWHGHLPVFERGVELVQPFGPVPPVQWVSQHPPLFYLLLAPVVGPLADGGHLYAAVLAGRAVNALVAGTTVLATWWAARQLVPGDRRVAGVAALVTAMTGMVVLVGGSIYNDLLAVTFAALALGLAAAVVRGGLTLRLGVLLALTSAGGLASRLSFGIFVVAMAGALVVAAHRGRPVRRELLARVAAALGLVVAPLLAVGWFYARNVALTGTVTGGHPDWSAANLGRNTHPVVEVVQAPTFWTGLFSLYRYDVDRADPLPWLALLVPLGLALVAAVLLVATRRLRPSRGDVLVVVMAAAVTALTVVMQLNYVAGGGAANTRYSLPVVPVIAVVTAWALCRGGRAGVVLVAVWAAGVFAAYTTAVDLSVAVGPASVLAVARVAFALSAVGVVTAVAAHGVATWRGASIGGRQRPERDRAVVSTSASSREAR